VLRFEISPQAIVPDGLLKKQGYEKQTGWQKTASQF
jgi:hypothetical protein